MTAWRRTKGEENVMLHQEIANYQGGMNWDNIRTEVFRLEQISSLYKHVKIP